MENFRSKSCKNAEVYSYSYGSGSYGGPPQPTSMQDLRCYSASHAYGKPQLEMNSNTTHSKEAGKNSNAKVKNGGGAGPASSASRSWSFTDAELQRKKRVASYKVYAVEGKMKGSIKKSFRWIKSTCSNVVYGSWW
ncbi:uncharacterized protein LOC116210245 [Punica granatum]|uniref:DUF3511 domain-containing protein n=2 Tax=Punica granatum TaxID=22663 RepID=A0A218X568_PUNGR|nr:uncharacterized protein LOC116210245 [Punica granatum]OWM79879.1 hypothetical protein CDL15_Pgr001522 [Punica granatum]PKI39877.1 hypothetical protein CRG98_039717 [Punica granatum]